MNQLFNFKFKNYSDNKSRITIHHKFIHVINAGRCYNKISLQIEKYKLSPFKQA